MVIFLRNISSVLTSAQTTQDTLIEQKEWIDISKNFCYGTKLRNKLQISFINNKNQSELSKTFYLMVYAYKEM